MTTKDVIPAYPHALQPNARELIRLIDRSTVTVPKVITRFTPWKGRADVNRYGGKQLLKWKKQPAFAELIVLWTLQKAGWGGVWVDSYRRKYRIGMLEENPVELPAPQKTLIEALRKKMKQHGGVWDVFCWKGDRVLFAELKRGGRDRIRDNQRLFLQTALSHGLPLDAFLIVEWDLEK